MRELEHLGIELSGRNLIEASAGTGKTYAIACLYLRLVIESDLTPEQILVVTYTEAATEELRGRIRSRIRQALDTFSGTVSKDPFLLGLVQKVNKEGPGEDIARNRLDRALKSFDLASIFTIHGFCLRALQDNAFESGSLYDTELITDQADLLQEVVDDFWRRTFFSEPAPLLGYALRTKLSPAYSSTFLKGMLGNPKLEILPNFDLGSIPSLQEECETLFSLVKEIWLNSHTEIRELIRSDKGLSRAKGAYNPDTLPPLFEAMDAYARSDNPFDLFSDFSKLCTIGILKGKKPTGAPLSHPFFDLCEQLRQRVGQRFLALKAELLAFAAEHVAARKSERNIRFFDDLLTSLYEALGGPRGDDFALCLRQKYRAALIDEFQDTDPVQFDIFRKIYADPAHPLFLIGDPKQAIYSFRGADIFAYLKAAAGVEATRRFTLTSNWRSAPALLAAFNALFDNDFKPFLFGEIAYHSVASGLEEEGNRLTWAEADDAPLQLWCVPPDEEGKASNVGRANKSVPMAVAAEIARLLRAGMAGEALIDGRPVLPEHIAVIVRSHRQAGYIQEALKNLSIPSVMRSDASIFTTREARQVCTLLAALAAPGNEWKLRAALVTDIFGLTGDDIATLLEEEPLWEEWLSKFQEYHQIWLERGFMVMVQTLLSREGVRGRLLRKPDGERRLTNLLHCCEILHAASQERSLGPEGLAVWFGERISAGDASEGYQIRLETDEKAVKILTIHVSKGLEYPIVFCPFLWAGVRSDEEVVTFHDDFRLVKDYGSADQELHRVLAQKESLAENLRLLYVALTRAKFRCYLVTGKIVDSTGRNRPETSPLAYLFHASATTRNADDTVGQLGQEVKKLSAEEMEQQLRAVAARQQDAISVSSMPEAGGAERYEPFHDGGERLSEKKFNAMIERDWRVSSFTSLASHDLSTTELPDRDEAGAKETALPPLPEADPREKSIFTFPKGAHAGIFLHEIFEKLDFSGSSGEKTTDLVAACLKKHCFGAEWQSTISDMIENVVSTQFSAPEGPFSLSDLRQGKWLAELEFFFPLKFVTSNILKECLGSWSSGCTAVNLQALAQSLRFRPAKGMVRGFMDMVFEHGGRFYLVDWKSNHLGYRVEAYGEKALTSAMDQNLYSLQYLLYTVALNRYLSLRIKEYRYETHFGGVLYLFLRGMDRERGEAFGVFRDTPPAGLIHEVTNCLIQAGG
ncbi:exodeoxyribonuclease V subunit beta [Pelobacter propionicus]|uniref:DNA 3'-5' helicase n=1 Tax=Pelobacter propionicus (strain DSM 2379 / NBRC 103807 / OttBd1) TaxID=338966 RepID=A1AQY7_PELPD|nr:exodeoxyribonuclease V subunit beta [Pelobacter propionicus]ABK99757.1 DNA helicase/exodeoxyribonuclease V, beta subunit [Pelobacter propionicus DSM 2379]